MRGWREHTQETGRTCTTAPWTLDGVGGGGREGGGSALPCCYIGSATGISAKARNDESVRRQRDGSVRVTTLFLKTEVGLPHER